MSVQPWEGLRHVVILLGLLSLVARCEAGLQPNRILLGVIGDTDLRIEVNAVSPGGLLSLSDIPPAEFLQVIEVYPDTPSQPRYRYDVKVDGRLIYHRDHIGTGFGRTSFIISLPAWARDRGPLTVTFGNTGDHDFMIELVRPVRQSELSRIETSDTFGLSGWVSFHNGLSKAQEYLDILYSGIPEREGFYRGFSTEIHYASSSPETIRGQIEWSLSASKRTGMSLLLTPVSWWAGTPRNVPDGEGGRFGDIRYQQIVWSPEDQTDEGSELRELLGERWDLRYGLTVPNVWANTPWLTMNSPRLNAHRQRTLASTLKLLAEEAPKSGAHLAGICLENEPRYWDSQIEASDPKSPRKTVWADFNPLTVASAKRDGVILDPSDGLDRDERLWLVRNVARYNQDTVDWTRSALKGTPLEHIEVYTHSLQLLGFPGDTISHPMSEFAYVNGAVTGIEGMWGKLSDFERIRDWGSWANVNREEEDGRDISEHLWDLRLTYARGGRFYNSYNWHAIGADRFLGYVKEFMDNLPVVQVKNANLTLESPATFSFSGCPDVQAANLIRVSAEISAPISGSLMALVRDSKGAVVGFSRVEGPLNSGAQEIDFVFSEPFELNVAEKNICSLELEHQAGGASIVVKDATIWFDLRRERSQSLLIAQSAANRSSGRPRPSAYALPPPVGFVCHYPFIDVGMDELPKSGASALIMRAVMGEIEKEEGKFDFSTLDKQIAYAEQNGFQVVLLLECNPVYCPPWLEEKIKAEGQMQKFQDGTDHNTPSISSRIFTEKRDEFIRKVIEYVKQRDTKRVITHYNPGAEWWFEHLARYNPLDVARFRDWLEDRYYDIETLNRVWESDFKSFEEVPPPKLDLSDFGRRNGLSRILSTEIRAQDCSWSTRQGFAPKVTPGKTYVFSAWVKTTNVLGRGAHLSTSWLQKGSDIPFHMNYSDGVEGTTRWRRIQMKIAAPMNADRVWLLLKLAGFGTADFDSPDFREEGSSENLLANPSLDEGDDTPDKWFFDNWIQGEGIEGQYLKSGGIGGSPCVRISIPHPDPVTRTYGNQDAAAHDWSLFWYEVGAQYINDFACVVKSADDSRPTATYLTYAFAFPVEWDYVFANAIAVDEVAIRGDCIHTLGMQICSADGDPFRVTANLDLVRKYGKPMWAIDLLDWTRGVAIGYQTNNKVAQAAVQHGASGIFHYCWHGTPDYDFYPTMKTDDMHRMLMSAREAIQLMRGMRVKPSVALIQPILPASPEDKSGFKNDYRSFYGWYKLLEAMHHTFDVVTLRELQKGLVDLRQYDWVLVPDCACLPSSAYYRLVKFAGWGGKLVLSGRFAERDEYGKPLKTDKAFLSGRSRTIFDYGKSYAGRMHRNTWAGNTPPLFIWRSDTPATRKALESAKSELARFFLESDVALSARLEPDDPSIRIVEWEGRGARAFYLVNMRKEPVQGARLCIRSGSPSELHVYADVKQTECDWKHSGEWVEVALPDFDASCIVRLGM